MFKAFVAAAAVITAPGAQAADQFDLICTGSTQATGEFHHEPISTRYHVDLATKQWCADKCTVRPLAEVNSTQIVFRDTKAAYRGDASVSLDYVDRTTGKWSFFTSYWQGDGTCQAAPFTGFPSPATKF
jgi:hypothetical protein